MNDQNMMKKVVLLCLFTVFAVGYALSAGNDDIEKKIDQLLSKMTLEEKIGQINQQTGQGYSPEMVQIVKAGGIGSILNEVDPVVVNKLQKEAMKNSRLHIPLIFARDVIHGFKTIFPIPLGQAASWNLALIEQGARIAAEEASSTGVRWTFSPMVDISRDARWGRCAESAGEDPYLAGKVGVAMVRGYQTDDLSQPNTMAACTKHFVGYGAAEGGKDYNSTWIPDVVMHDVYLPPFKACAKAGSATFMCAFNDNNGIPASANRYLMRDVLRDKWGWDGVMCSDWGSIMQLVPQGYCTDLKDAALKAALAGVDVDMESYAYTRHLKALVEEGKVDEKVIDGLVRNVLRLKFRLGLFDNPYVDMKRANQFYAPESLEAAERMVEESTVLLKNNGVLPFTGKKVALVGPMADAKHDQNGTWCFDLDKTHTVTPLETLRQTLGDNLVFEPGLTYSRDKSEEGIRKAVEAAKQADIVVMVAGEEAVLSGEAHCRADLSLPGAQTEMLKALKATGKPVVLVLFTGRPLILNWEQDNVPAILNVWFGGSEAAYAIGDVLFGRVNPSGKLTMSFPQNVGQIPLYYAHKNTGRPLHDGKWFEKFRSNYLDVTNEPLYPFGFGLSYTTFAYSDISLSQSSMDMQGMITASVDVSNTGLLPGGEVVQLYIRDLVGSTTRPVKELKGFERIYLQPGQTRTVTFKIAPEMLKFYDYDLQYVIEPGDFQVMIGSNSRDVKTAAFTVTSK
mgnify:CR=1 FL=1